MPVPPAASRPAWWNLGGRAVRVLDLIETLRERERFGGAAPVVSRTLFALLDFGLVFGAVLRVG